MATPHNTRPNYRPGQFTNYSQMDYPPKEEKRTKATVRVPSPAWGRNSGRIKGREFESSLSLCATMLQLNGLDPIRDCGSQHTLRC